MYKCHLGVTSLTALGYALYADGLTASKGKIRAIQQIPETTTIKKLRQALGLISYQRQFFSNAARIKGTTKCLSQRTCNKCYAY